MDNYYEDDFENFENNEDNRKNFVNQEEQKEDTYANDFDEFNDLESPISPLEKNSDSENIKYEQAEEPGQKNVKSNPYIKAQDNSSHHSSSKPPLQKSSSKPPPRSFSSKPSSLPSSYAQKIIPMISAVSPESEALLFKENATLRMYLKEFNQELDKLIEKQKSHPPTWNKPPLKRGTKKQEKENNLKKESGRFQTVLEEIKINKKKMEILDQEVQKLEKRMNLVGEGNYVFGIQKKIEESRKIIEETKKFNKLVLLDNNKKGKNLDNIENVFGITEEVKKGNEITSLLPGLLKKNKELKEKKTATANTLVETNRKLEEIEQKMVKLEELAGIWGIVEGEGVKKDKYEQLQYKIDALEKTIESLRKSREKTLELMKKGVEDLLKNLKSLDDQISSKELEILSLRQKVEALISSEKISKDFLLKPLSPPSFISPIPNPQPPSAPSQIPSYPPPSSSSSTTHPLSANPVSSPLPIPSADPSSAFPLPSPPSSSPPLSPSPPDLNSKSHTISIEHSSVPFPEVQGILPHSSVQNDVVLINKENIDTKLYNFSKKKEEKSKLDISIQAEPISPPPPISQPQKVFNFSKNKEEDSMKEMEDEKRKKEDERRKREEDERKKQEARIEEDNRRKKEEEERIKKEEKELKRNEEEANRKKEEENKKKEETEKFKKGEEDNRKVLGKEPIVNQIPQKKKFNANLWDDSEVTNPFDIPEVAAKPIDLDIGEGNYYKKEKGVFAGIDKENEPKGEFSVRRGEKNVRDSQNSVQESMNVRNSSIANGELSSKESRNAKETQNSGNPPINKKKIADPFEIQVQDGEDWDELNNGGGTQMKGKMKIEEKVLEKAIN